MDSIISNDCPVCGYELGFRTWINLSASDEICPCCGIQYGSDDAAGGDVKQRELIYKEWRNRWIQDKMPWKSYGISPPENWNPVIQLRNLE